MDELSSNQDHLNQSHIDKPVLYRLIQSNSTSPNTSVQSKQHCSTDSCPALSSSLLESSSKGVSGSPIVEQTSPLKDREGHSPFDKSPKYDSTFEPDLVSATPPLNTSVPQPHFYSVKTRVMGSPSKEIPIPAIVATKSPLKYSNPQTPTYSPDKLGSEPGLPFTPLSSSFAGAPRVSKVQRKVHIGGVKLPIAGVNVEFPFEPYSVQKYMMSQVLLSCKKAQNCLLESPTGTGKTLALLCSTLAWQQHQSDFLQQLEKLAFDHDNTNESSGKTPTDIKKPGQPSSHIPTPHSAKVKDGTLPSDSDDDDIFQSPKRIKKSVSTQVSPVSEAVTPGTLCLEQQQPKKSPAKTPDRFAEAMNDSLDQAGNSDNRPPKIFYGTRTHKQIAQVVDQLKRTVYASKVKMTILAARDHTCINGQVRNSNNVTEQCQELIDPVKGFGCSYYTGTSKMVSHSHLQAISLPVVYDIEDMIKVGSRKKMCPYFTLRNLVLQSDIIFCPYNYLIDPGIRESMNINVGKAIVIMDEAHNIEDVCRDSGSFWIKQNELEKAISECKENIKRKINAVEYTLIEDYLQSLHDWLSKAGPAESYTAGNEGTTSQKGAQIIVRLEIEDITEAKFQVFKDSIDRINKDKQDNPDDNLSMSGMVKQISYGLRTVLNYLYRPENRDKYQAYLTREVGTSQPKSSMSGTWLGKHRQRQSEERVWKYSMHLLCLSPAIVFSELLEARTIVLASGTLSPLDSFQSELAVKFPYVVKGRHVVSKDNLFVSTLMEGPQRVSFRGVYENTNKYEYQDELGRAILETSKIVPHGVLCFFPSYTLMDKLKERWIATGLAGQLEGLKEVFWEPRRKQEMNSVMEEFTNRIQLSTEYPGEEIGAIMFGVFRGKIAEGIDFSDDNARVVIAVGIPFMNRNTMEVNLKIKYNDENIKNDLLSGNRWYRIQAFRALNQALGRCIRHQNDWGAIILLDTRFSLKDTQENLPSWIQQQLRPYQNWESYLRGLSAFCSRMKPQILNS